MGASAPAVFSPGGIQRGNIFPLFFSFFFFLLLLLSLSLYLRIFLSLSLFLLLGPRSLFLQAIVIFETSAKRLFILPLLSFSFLFLFSVIFSFFFFFSFFIILLFFLLGINRMESYTAVSSRKQSPPWQRGFLVFVFFFVFVFVFVFFFVFVLVLVFFFVLHAIASKSIGTAAPTFTFEHKCAIIPPDEFPHLVQARECPPAFVRMPRHSFSK